MENTIPALIITHAVVTTLIQLTLFATHIPSTANTCLEPSNAPLPQEDAAAPPESRQEESDDFPIQLDFSLPGKDPS